VEDEEFRLWGSLSLRSTLDGCLLLLSDPLTRTFPQTRFHPWSLDTFSGDEGPMNNAYPGCDGYL